MHEFTDSYGNVWGLTIASDSQLLVVASTYDSKKYKLFSFTLDGNALTMQWQMDGSGRFSITSPLYDGKYLVVGSFDSVIPFF